MCKIMIAEDDPKIRSLFKQILLSKGYDTVVATDGEQAVRIYDSLKEKPDIIIVDFRMPKLNGLEVTKEILQRDPTMSILMITGDPQVNHNTCVKNGIRYKSKPVRMDEFLQEIRSIAEI
ncbi:MAG: response regulator [Candidatus Heimdallarchaeota archaeon]